MRCFSACMAATSSSNAMLRAVLAWLLRLSMILLARSTLIMRSSTSMRALALVPQNCAPAPKAVTTPSTMTRANPNPMAVPTFMRFFCDVCACCMTVLSVRVGKRKGNSDDCRPCTQGNNRIHNRPIVTVSINQRGQLDGPHPGCARNGCDCPAMQRPVEKVWSLPPQRSGDEAPCLGTQNMSCQLDKSCATLGLRDVARQVLQARHKARDVGHAHGVWQ